MSAEKKPGAPFPSQSFEDLARKPNNQGVWPAGGGHGRELKIEQARGWVESPQWGRGDSNGRSQRVAVNESSPWDNTRLQETEYGRRTPRKGKHQKRFDRPRIHQSKPAAPPNGNNGFVRVNQHESWDAFTKRGGGDVQDLEDSYADFAAAVAEMDAQREENLLPRPTVSLESTDEKLMDLAIQESIKTANAQLMKEELEKQRAVDEEVQKAFLKSMADLAVKEEPRHEIGMHEGHQGAPTTEEAKEPEHEKNQKPDNTKSEKKVDLREMELPFLRRNDEPERPRLDAELPADFRSDDVDKSSDESDFSDDGEFHHELHPLGTGWQHALFLGSRLTREGIAVEIYLANMGMVTCSPISPEIAEKIKNATFIRLKKDSQGQVRIAPTRHSCARATSVKVRPGRSVEVRTTAVVAYTNACDPSSISIWCDPIGWLSLDITRQGVLRRGTERDLGWSTFKPLKIVEFTVRVRVDIPFHSLTQFRDGIMISDLVQVCHLDKNGIELPTKYFPLVPRRFYDLRLVNRKPDKEGRHNFRSKSHPELAFWTHTDQYAYKDEMNCNMYAMAGVFVPVAENQYRALVVGPAQIVMYQCKDRLLDYRRASVKRQYKPTDKQLIERLKAKGAELDELLAAAEYEGTKKMSVFL